MKNIKHQTSNIKINSKSKNPTSRFWIWRLVFGICLGFGLLMFEVSAGASIVNSNDLLNNADLYNGKTITYEGEVVGDIIDGWININDGNAAIGVYVGSKELLDEISYLGNYRNMGDTIRITGEFYKADPNHGGDLDIRAKELEIIKLGTPIKHNIERSKINSLLSLIGITIFLYIFKTIIYRKKT